MAPEEDHRGPGQPDADDTQLHGQPATAVIDKGGGEYRGEYGIEDTRRALIEAKRDGVHPFCITIDREGQDYLPHMYGPIAYTIVDAVEKLPYKVSEIYRRLTT